MTFKVDAFELSVESPTPYRLQKKQKMDSNELSVIEPFQQLPRLPMHHLTISWQDTNNRLGRAREVSAPEMQIEPSPRTPHWDPSSSGNADETRTSMSHPQQLTTHFSTPISLPQVESTVHPPLTSPLSPKRSTAVHPSLRAPVSHEESVAHPALASPLSHERSTGVHPSLRTSISHDEMPVHPSLRAIMSHEEMPVHALPQENPEIYSSLRSSSEVPRSISNHIFSAPLSSVQKSRDQVVVERSLAIPKLTEHAISPASLPNSICATSPMPHGSGFGNANHFMVQEPNIFEEDPFQELLMLCGQHNYDRNHLPFMEELLGSRYDLDKVRLL